MSNAYLENTLKNRLKVKGFLGVFPCNRMPKLDANQSFIANTDPHTRPGKHFVAFSKNSLGKVTYFDSLNLDPRIGFPELHEHMQRMGLETFARHLKKAIQSPFSDFCGLFCMDFILSRRGAYRRGRLKKYTQAEHLLHRNDRTCIANIVKRLKNRN